MKKFYLISICFILFNISSISAQTFGGMIASARDYERKSAIDTCRLRIIYDYKYSKDTLRNKLPYKDMMCIEVGDKINHYYSVYADKYDSVVYEIRIDHEKYKPKNPHADGCIAGISTTLDLQPGVYPRHEDVFINYPQGHITMNVRYCSTDYIYEEPMEKITWHIIPSADSPVVNILGYDCIKATCSFRGRSYEVWFTPEIPVRTGPWKLSGLPGAILRANDTDNFFQWEAIGIENPDDRLIYSYEGESMPLKDRAPYVGKNPDIIKRVTKKEVDRIRRLSWSDPITLLAAHDSSIAGGFTFFDGQKTTVIKPGDLSYPYIPTLELE